MVRQKVASEDDRVTKGLIGIVDAHLGTDTPPNTFLRTSLHLGKMFEIVLDTVVTMLGCDSIETLITHLYYTLTQQT